MKTQKTKGLTGRITDYVAVKRLTFQVVGGITDPNEDQDAPRTKSETRQNSTS
jgi:hypothetical protein